jgi:hypothetical protein
MAENKHFDSINAPCDAVGAYNFVKNERKTIGHLLKVKFSNSGKELVADTDVQDPMNEENLVTVVGVFDNDLGWEGSPDDALLANFRLSLKNKAIMQRELSALNGGAEIELSFVVYEYGENEQYFKHFHTKEEEIKCVLTKNTKVFVSPRPATDVKGNVTYQVNCSLSGKSKGKEQVFHIAYSHDEPFTRRFGVVDAKA